MPGHRDLRIRMKTMPRILYLLLVCLVPAVTLADTIVIAAASDMQFAMRELVADFLRDRPQDHIDAVYGSSGRFHAQIRQGAPFDLYLSADIRYPRQLVAQGLSAGPARPYALGHLVLWSRDRDMQGFTLEDLLDPTIVRIAIANPRHAPYGRRAEEALRATGLWERLRPRLVMGENIAQTAQLASSGNAQVGVIALSLALSPALASQGSHVRIPAELHSPLVQGFIVTRHGAGKPLAQAFADYVQSGAARAILRRFGFEPPPEGG